MPPIYDPGRLLGQHDGDWLEPHPSYDYYPGPNGVQHRVDIANHVFRGHGVPASLLPSAP